MANTPKARSYNQILSDQLGTFISKTGIARIKIANPILSIFESVSQSQLRTSSDIFQLLASENLDNATGQGLVRLGARENLTKLSASSATGYVVVTDTSFTKISNQIYQGTGAPIPGSVSVNIEDGSLFPSTGSIYIGRNTNNYEGPIAYTSISNAGSYWTINLTTPTANFHNLGESVILAQGGNRSVRAGSIVQTSQVNSSQPIQFKTLYAATLPDGESTSVPVLVASVEVGTSNNIDANSIQGFLSSPFTGATATNPNAFTNGRDTETDPQFRERIRLARQSRGLGTKLAIQNAALGVSSAEENKTVVSTSYVTNLNSPDTLFIDDGSGYEEVPVPINYEVLIGSAYGGEQSINTSSPTPVSKAFLQTTLNAPFALEDGSSLSVLVGGTLSVHTFEATSFKNINSASAYEVCASINSDSNCLFSARTSNNGLAVSITAKQTDFEKIQIISGNTELDANSALSFPLYLADTLKLYKNGILLTKDGSPATLTSNLFSSWAALNGSQTLTLSIDGTPNLTFTFTDSDFINANTGFSSLGNNTLDAWVSVFSSKIPGIIVSVTGNRIQFKSNYGYSSKAQISIISGSLVSNNVFAIQTVVGEDNDYSFDRNTGSIELTTPLSTGDSLTIGTTETRSFVQSSPFTSVSPSSEADFWFGLDQNYSIISTGIVNTSSLTVSYSTNSTPWAYQLRIGSTASIFNNVQKSDQLIIWDGNANSTLQNAWRVVNVDTNGTWIEITKPNCHGKRFLHGAIKLTNGKIFVVGGNDSNGILSSGEIYDPSTNTWTQTSPMNYARGDIRAVQLNDGRILITGGYIWTQEISSGVNVGWLQTTTNTAEIYDPTSDTWTIVANHPNASGIAAYTAGLLTSGSNSGKVLIAGGESYDGTNFNVNNTSYLYDPVANTWATTGNLVAARSEAAFCTLGNGNILVAGGYDASQNPLSTAEYYNITSGTWTATGNSIATATVYGNMVWNQNSGFAEYFGGYTVVPTSGNTVSNTLSRYNPGTNTWTSGVSASSGMSKGVWAVMTNGYIIAIGDNGSGVQVSQVYNSSSNTWAAAISPPSNSNLCFATGFELSANKLLISHGVPGIYSNFYDASAVSFICDLTTPTSGVWSYTDPSIGTFSLSSAGFVFARLNKPVSKQTISSGSNYTASSVADLLNSELTGSQVETYKTNSLKFITNTEGLNGSIGLITQNSNASLFNLNVNPVPVENTTGHNGSIESGIGEVSVPFVGGLSVSGVSTKGLDITFLPGNTTRFDSSLISMFSMAADVEYSTPIYNFGQNRWYYSQQLSQYSNQRGAFLRNIPSQLDLIQNIHFMQPFKFSAYDTLSVLIDNNIVNSNYNINMWRTIKPTNNSYGSSNAFTDSDNSNQSLAVAFGYGTSAFDFNDFAVHMAARTKTFSSDSTKSILYRFNKLGPDGNNAILEYALPTGPNLNPTQNVLIDKAKTNTKDTVQIQLASGAASTGSIITSSGYIGMCGVDAGNDLVQMFFVLGYSISSASRTSNVTTLVLTIPSGITAHGLSGFIYFSGAGSFPAGNYLIQSSTSTTISYVDTGSDVSSTSISATVSKDIQTASFSSLSPTLATGQFFRINTSNSYLANTGGVNKTIRIASFGSQYVSGYIRNSEYGFATSGTVVWNALLDGNAISIFANPSQTAATIAGYFNSTSPTNATNAVNATLLGDGSGIIDRSTAEQEGNGDFYYYLTDGLNFIQTTTSPGTLSSNYSLSFKDPINSNLMSSADWQNEIVRIVPVTTKNCVNWLNCKGVTGLSSAALIERSSNAEKVQITTQSIGSSGSVQVLGGSANETRTELYGSPVFTSATSFLSAYNYAAFKVKTSESQNLIAGQRILVTNSSPVVRPGPLASGNSNISISAPNGLVISSTSMFNSAFTRNELSNIGFEVLNDGFVMIYGIVTSMSMYSDGWVYIDKPALNNVTNVSSVNCGLFKIVNVGYGGGSNGLLIQNPNAIDQFGVSAGVVSIRNFKELALPGDFLNINTTALGTTNLGSRQILSIGAGYVQAAPGSINRSGSTVTVTSPYAHGFQAGDVFTISPGETNFTNQVYTVASVISSTSFTYSDSGINGSNSIEQTIQGFLFKNAKIFRIDPTLPLQTVSGVNLSSTDGAGTSVTGGSLESSVKTIVSITPSGVTDSVGNAYSWIKLTPFDMSASTRRSTISQEVGSSISALTKLHFPTTASIGNDAYYYSGGLIEEVSKTIYGVSSDPTTYPGVVAGGNSIEISGPYIRRIQVAVSVKLRAFTPESSVLNKVRSGITAVINNTPIGQNIAISDIIDAASGVTGVISVTFDSPIYNAENDSIIINPNEKPLVVDATNDIQVSVIGD